MSAQNKLIIKCEEDAKREPHPYCPHGPTLLFYRVDTGVAGGYFACAAYRRKGSCNFHLPCSELTSEKLNRRYDQPLREYREQRHKFLYKKPVAEEACSEVQQQHFCLSCNIPLLTVDLSSHIDHNLERNLPPKLLREPTQLLRPLDNDQVQAQYFFDENSLKFFAKCFSDLGINKVVCMGAPRLHEYLNSQNVKPKVKSFLLDFDHRFYYFYEDDEFAWYNMCNNYFFDAQQKCNFEKFLHCKDITDRLAIFTDPPFGCRTEVITHTLHQLVQLYNTTNQKPHQPLPIFWIFPYFSEHHLRQQMPEMHMCDYKVNYTNHAIYTNIGDKCRKLGSPVRLFTNVPIDRLILPIEEGGYKYCAICQRYTAMENRHCSKCGICPSKNGTTYRHCHLCGICVKPTYVHCSNCRRCTQVEDHDCIEYQKQQHCWICRQPGHIERDCWTWHQYCKLSTTLRSRVHGRNENKNMCLLCTRKGHNERNCKLRSKYIEEQTFLGETQVKFKAIKIQK